MLIIHKPKISEVPDYMQGYVSLVQDNNLLSALHQSLDDLHIFLQKLPESKANYKYTEGKWSIKEILQHLIDAERVFNYRALHFAREGYREMGGYDQDIFVKNAKVSQRSLIDLKTEFITVRTSSIYLFDSFTKDNLLQKGKASGFEISVPTLGFAIIGHTLHHFKVIENKYL